MRNKPAVIPHVRAKVAPTTTHSPESRRMSRNIFMSSDFSDLSDLLVGGGKGG